MARPRGGDWLEDEVQALCLAQVHLLASALTLAEVTELELTKEETICAAHSITFVTFPIVDRSVPANANLYLDLIERLFREWIQGRRIVVHCRGGIGRASLIAAGILSRGGLSARDALDKITSVRGCPVPDTPEQAEWLERITPRLRASA